MATAKKAAAKRPSSKKTSDPYRTHKIYNSPRQYNGRLGVDGVNPISPNNPAPKTQQTPPQ